MNIKISDLSIGDYISYCDRVYKVHSIEGQGLVGASNDSYSSPHILKHINYLEPITITPEILKKNGFYPPRESVAHDSWWWTNNDSEAMEASDFLGVWHFKIVEHKDPHFKQSAGMVLKYIHQLQNALRLAGVDKEINL